MMSMPLISVVSSCFLFLHLALAVDLHANVCGTRQNYTANSTYLSNLKHLLASLNLLSLNNSDKVIMGLEQNITDHLQFDKLVDKLMTAVADWAAYNTSRLFATGQMNSTDNIPTLYSLVQCTPDLSRRQCRQCLQQLIEDMTTSLEGEPAGVVLRVQCHYNGSCDSLIDQPPVNWRPPYLDC